MIFVMPLKGIENNELRHRMKVSEEYPFIYHYTTYQGIEGILKTQSLWATHYQYLNDSQEVIYAKRILNSILISKMMPIVERGVKQEDLRAIAEAHGGARAFAERSANKLIEIIYETLLDEAEAFQGPYIVSFCAHIDSFTKDNGLLSQWRGYGKDGGFAIEFDARKLEELVATECNDFYYPIALFADVAYGENLEEGPIDFKEDVLSLQILLEEFVKTLSHEFISKALDLLVKLLARSKHEGFREEKEVRAAFFAGSAELQEKDRPLKHKNIKQIKVRSMSPCPYIDLFEGKNALPIRRIIVGPHKEQALREKVLKIKVAGMNIQVTSSKIPFLGN